MVPAATHSRVSASLCVHKHHRAGHATGSGRCLPCGHCLENPRNHLPTRISRDTKASPKQRRQPSVSLSLRQSFCQTQELRCRSGDQTAYVAPLATPRGQTPRALQLFVTLPPPPAITQSWGCGFVAGEPVLCKLPGDEEGVASENSQLGCVPSPPLPSMLQGCPSHGPGHGLWACLDGSGVVLTRALCPSLVHSPDAWARDWG